MAELLENSDNTNVDAGVSESPANEATISLAAAQALADALQKIEAYTPTVWVDNESPDIDAVHLNKAEQAIMRVTDAMNSAVDTIKDLQSQLNTTNNNLSNTDERVTQLYSDSQSRFVDMSNFTRSQLEAVWVGNKTIIGFVGWEGSFSPNTNTGIVLAGGSCAVLVSVTGEIYMQTSTQDVKRWEKRGIQYEDINVTITSDQWITSANGLKYFNHSGWNIPTNALGISANISSWSGTAGNVTCSIYNNSYIQFRCENAVNWTGTVRVVYSKR